MRMPRHELKCGRRPCKEKRIAARHQGLDADRPHISYALGSLACRHRSVIKPQLFVPCGQEDRQYVHAAGEWNDGSVEEPERNKAEATELVNPVPDALRHGGCCARDSQESEHFSFESSIIVAREIG